MRHYIPLISIVMLVMLLGACSTSPQMPVSDDVALPIARKNNCMACHSIDRRIVGPSFNDIGARYKGQDVQQYLFVRIRQGGSGVWGPIPEPPQRTIPDNDLKLVVRWITERNIPQMSAPGIGQKDTSASQTKDISIDTTPKRTVSTESALPLARKNMCFACHRLDIDKQPIIGPPLKAIAARYRGEDAEQKLFENVQGGSAGVWSNQQVQPPMRMPENELRLLLRWILELEP